MQKTAKKVHGKPLRPYENPVKPESLPIRSLSAKQEDDNKVKVIYKVIVKTGNLYSCGTDAEVSELVPMACLISGKVIVKFSWKRYQDSSVVELGL